MTTVTNYSSADAYLQGGRNKSDRPIENNTRVRRLDDGRIAIRLHETDVVVYERDGTVELNSGGWLTVTTKARMNEFIGARWASNFGIGSDRGRWYIYDGTRDQKVPFFDGIRIRDGRIVNPRPEGLEKRLAEAEDKMGKAIDRYIDGYFAAMERGEVAPPSGGDCWDCSMIVSGGPDEGKPMGDVKARDPRDSHLFSHITERYYVPSLLWNAVKARGYRDVGVIMSMRLDRDAWALGQMRVARAWQSTEPSPFDRKELRRELRKYMRKQLIPSRAS